MGGCNKCREINVSLKYESLQVLPWYNDTTTEKMDSWDWCRKITDLFQHIHFWNQRDIIGNYNIIHSKHSKFERRHGYNCYFIIEKRSFIEWVAATGIVNYLNTFQISVKYIVYTQFIAASALLKNTISIEE